MPNLLRAPTREYCTASMDSHQWEGFEPRSDDIVVATYPKCGTTWTQRIVDLLIFQTPEARPVSDIAPWLDRTASRIEKILAVLAAQTHRRSIKTHAPFDAVPIYESVKYIHVARDGRDACFSMHNHAFNFRPEWKERNTQRAQRDPRIRLGSEAPEDPRAHFLKWIEEAEEPNPDAFGKDLPFFEFENTYWSERKRENVLFVHYNDLKADLPSEMERIASFLEIGVPRKSMDDLAQAATFEAMKRDGASLMPGAENLWAQGADRFFHKGINDRWKEILTKDDIARYERLAKSKWSEAACAWIANGRLIAGDPRTISR